MFGKERYGVARWGLYNLLKDAQPFRKFSLRIADFSYEGAGYPLAPDFEGEWAVYDSGCDLVFVNNKWGFKTLPEFLEVLNLKAEINTYIYPQWWRPSTVQYHWYETGGHFYSDYYDFTHLPSVLMVSGGIFLGGYGVGGYARDRYGNQYYSGGGGFVLGAGIADHWEGYASRNLPGNVPRESRILPESELKHIIAGGSWSFEASWISSGIGVTFNQAGTILMFGDTNALMGGAVGGSWTWEYAVKDFYRAWDWVEDISRYGPTQE